MNINVKPVHWFTFQNKQKSRLNCHTHQAFTRVSYLSDNGPKLLITSAEAEQAKGKWAGLLPTATISKVAHSVTI